MQTTVCAYCDHEVKITPDGTCLYCGGNLAEESFVEERDNRMTRIRNFLIGEPIPRKSRKELYAPYRTQLGKSGHEIKFQNIRDRLVEERESQVQKRESQVQKEMKELDNFTKTVSESETVKTLVKSLSKPLIPFWFKFGAFLLGLIIGAFFAFPDIQIPLLETFKLINSSPYLILAMSFIPILFLLIMIQKFDRRMF